MRQFFALSLLLLTLGNIPLPLLAAGSVTFTDTTAPTIEILSPYDNAGNVSFIANMILTFDEIVVAQEGFTLSIHKTSDQSIVEDINLAGSQVTGSRTTTITVNPSVTLTKNTSYFITFSEGAFTDLAGNILPGISDAITWNFTTINTSSNPTLPATPVDYTISNVSTTQNDNSILISWTSGGSVTLINVLASYDSGATWDYVTEGAYDTGNFTWDIPASPEGNTVLFKVQSTDRIVITGEADSSPVTLQEETVDPTTPPNEPADDITSQVSPGMLVKATSFSTVYLVTDEYTRRPFPTESVFSTYADSFTDVVEISDDLITQLPMGRPVLPRAGSVLVKTQLDARVYEVSDNDQLVYLTSEAQAALRHGDSWNTLVIDLDQAFLGWAIRNAVNAE